MGTKGNVRRGIKTMHPSVSVVKQWYSDLTKQPDQAISVHPVEDCPSSGMFVNFDFLQPPTRKVQIDAPWPDRRVYQIDVSDMRRSEVWNRVQEVKMRMASEISKTIKRRR